MPARLYLITTPDMAVATARLLARWRESRLPSVWLTPSRRAAGELRPLLDDPASRVLTLQQCADEIVHHCDREARPLSQTQQRLMIEDILADLHARGQLAYFRRHFDSRSLADLALGFLRELKQGLITPRQFDSTASSDREQDCAAIWSAYHQRLQLHHLYDQDGRLWRAGELAHQQPSPSLHNVLQGFVLGFADFTAAQRNLLIGLAQRLPEMWIALPDLPDDERTDLFSLPRQEIAAWADQGTSATAGGKAISRPAGLRHLARQLFRPRHRLRRASHAEGLLCIEAPGRVGEARMAAREIRQLLDGGISADAILVAVRDLAESADLLREVFTAFRIPVDVEGAEPLHRNPAVAVLLRTLRLHDEDWPFAGTTALLRNAYFRHAWAEAESEVPLASEALLRLFGEARGRDTFLKAAHHWAEKVHPGWEDEQAEESRRKRMHELAVRCLPFLKRLFHIWDDAPARGSPAQMIAWLNRIAGDLGIRAVAGEDPRDAAAFQRLDAELAQWADHQHRVFGDRAVDRAQFLRKFGSLAAEAGTARTPRGPGRVRVLSAELAVGLDVDHLFLLGLGERSFPQLAPPDSLLDDAQRQMLRDRGLPGAVADDRLPGEMLLFYRLATAPRRQLVLSFAAVDDRGQDQLPSSFLAAARDCFTANTLPVLRRHMLIEGLDSDVPLSPAEWRVWAARHGIAVRTPLLPPDTAANLAAAADLTRQRFACRDFTRFDGWLRDSAVVADLQSRFGPESVLSPTALENYVACPFKFFLRNVLGLQLLEEPAEEIESTDRGLAFHRALSRLHIHLQKTGVDQPEPSVEAAFLGQLDQAIREHASRASLAGEVLWGLEGERLKRLGKGYHRHWQKFVEPWHPHGVRPRPRFFEVSFGLRAAEGEKENPPLVIRMDGIEVRISGRIDRVDVADLPDGEGQGFWVIDYKTGRSKNYTSRGLTDFTRLQLTLYALATEQVLLQGQNARPLGMAYWLVIDGGARMALPAHPRKPVAWFDETEAWHKVRTVLERWVIQLVSAMRQGEFPLQPRNEDCTVLCDYSQICRISQTRAIVQNKTWQLPLPTVS